MTYLFPLFLDTVILGVVYVGGWSSAPVLSLSLSLSLWSLNKEPKLQLSHKLTMTIIMVSLGETGTSHVKTVLNICGKSVLVLTDNWVGVALNKIKCQPKIFVWEGETIILICNFSNYNIFIHIYIFMHLFFFLLVKKSKVSYNYI